MTRFTHSTSRSKSPRKKNGPDKSVRVPRWDTIQVMKFEKNFYRELSVVRKRPMNEIDQFRKEHKIVVNGKIIPNPVLNFSEIAFPKYIEDSIRDSRWVKPTPIQSQGWPMALSGNDVVGIAQTGSGKTAAFLLPAIIHIEAQPPLSLGDGPVCLILVPTRELAQQVEKVASEFSGYAKIKVACCYGGTLRQSQKNALLRCPEIVIATPGRLIDFLNDKALTLRRCTYLVLDEADRMLDMGFEPDIRRIISQVRPDRQTLMWSATWPREVQILANDFLVNYLQVNIGSLELHANPDIKQKIEIISEVNKEARLLEILRENKKMRALIFAETKRKVDELSRILERKGVDCSAMHGDKMQKERDSVLQNFRIGRCYVLVATDVASRGLDIDDIEFVINYDYPSKLEDYIHRIGRTGRSGKKGIAYTFINPMKIRPRQITDLINVLEEAKQDIPRELIDIARQGLFVKNRYAAPVMVAPVQAPVPIPVIVPVKERTKTPQKSRSRSKKRSRSRRKRSVTPKTTKSHRRRSKSRSKRRRSRSRHRKRSSSRRRRSRSRHRRRRSSSRPRHRRRRSVSRSPIHRRRRHRQSTSSSSSSSSKYSSSSSRSPTPVRTKEPVKRVAEPVEDKPVVTKREKVVKSANNNQQELQKEIDRRSIDIYNEAISIAALEMTKSDVDALPMDGQEVPIWHNNFAEEVGATCIEQPDHEVDMDVDDYHNLFEQSTVEEELTVERAASPVDHVDVTSPCSDACADRVTVGTTDSVTDGRRETNSCLEPVETVDKPVSRMSERVTRFHRIKKMDEQTAKSEVDTQARVTCGYTEKVLDLDDIERKLFENVDFVAETHRWSDQMKVVDESLSGLSKDDKLCDKKYLDIPLPRKDVSTVVATALSPSIEKDVVCAKKLKLPLFEKISFIESFKDLTDVPLPEDVPASVEVPCLEDVPLPDDVPPLDDVPLPDYAPRLSDVPLSVYAPRLDDVPLPDYVQLLEDVPLPDAIKSRDEDRSTVKGVVLKAGDVEVLSGGSEKDKKTAGESRSSKKESHTPKKEAKLDRPSSKKNSKDAHSTKADRQSSDKVKTDSSKKETHSTKKESKSSKKVDTPSSKRDSSHSLKKDDKSVTCKIAGTPTTEEKCSNKEEKGVHVEEAVVPKTEEENLSSLMRDDVCVVKEDSGVSPGVDQSNLPTKRNDPSIEDECLRVTKKEVCAATAESTVDKKEDLFVSKKDARTSKKDASSSIKLDSHTTKKEGGKSSTKEDPKVTKKEGKSSTKEDTKAAKKDCKSSTKEDSKVAKKEGKSSTKEDPKVAKKEGKSSTKEDTKIIKKEGKSSTKDDPKVMKKEVKDSPSKESLGVKKEEKCPSKHEGKTKTSSRTSKKDESIPTKEDGKSSSKNVSNVVNETEKMSVKEEESMDHSAAGDVSLSKCDLGSFKKDSFVLEENGDKDNVEDSGHVIDDVIREGPGCSSSTNSRGIAVQRPLDEKDDSAAAAAAEEDSTTCKIMMDVIGESVSIKREEDGDTAGRLSPSPEKDNKDSMNEDVFIFNNDDNMSIKMDSFSLKESTDEVQQQQMDDGTSFKEPPEGKKEGERPSSKRHSSVKEDSRPAKKKGSSSTRSDVVLPRESSKKSDSKGTSKKEERSSGSRKETARSSKKDNIDCTRKDVSTERSLEVDNVMEKVFDVAEGSRSARSRSRSDIRRADVARNGDRSKDRKRRRSSDSSDVSVVKRHKSNSDRDRSESSSSVDSEDRRRRHKKAKKAKKERKKHKKDRDRKKKSKKRRHSS